MSSLPNYPRDSSREVKHRSAPKRSLAQSLIGLVAGLVLYGAWVFIVALNTPSYRVAGRSLMWDLCGLIIPVLGVVFGPRLSPPIAIVQKDNLFLINCLAFAIVILLNVIFLMVYATLMAGYC